MSDTTAIMTCVDRIAKGEENRLGNYATGTLLWPTVDGSGVQALEDRVKGATLTAIDALLTAGGGAQWNDAAVFHRDLGADTGAQAGFEGGAEETRRTAEGVAVEERHRRQPVCERGLDERLGSGGTAQKAEGAAGVKFDVAHGQTAKRRNAEGGAEGGFAGFLFRHFSRSVVFPLDEVGFAVAQEAVEAAGGEGDVPLGAGPRAIGLPPIAAAAPRAAHVGDRAVETLGPDVGGLPIG